MKRNWISLVKTAVMIPGIIISTVCYSQNPKAVVKKYLTFAPSGSPDTTLCKYRMTAIYTNRDLYGKFMNKIRVTGDYTWGLGKGYVTWNNVYISNLNTNSDSFPEGVKQEYMENFKYIPSEKMVQADAFKNFPATPENVFSRNLIWDMLSFEMYGWRFLDSLKLNRPYDVKLTNGEFDMAEIGKYNHNKIILCWKGISEVEGELCAIIDFNAIDNLLELTMDQIKSKGTEQYWGTVWVSLKTRRIEYAYMFSGTMLETEVKNFPNKLLIKTIRELYLEKIR